MKVVGLYKSHSNTKSNKGGNNGQDNYLLTISLIGLGVIILIVCGIFMGKYLFKKKKRLNTLDDEYDYSEAKNQNIINE